MSEGDLLYKDTHGRRSNYERYQELNKNANRISNNKKKKHQETNASNRITEKTK